jgi:hypothetical protein
MTMRLCRQVLTIGLISFATPLGAEPSHRSPSLPHVQDFKQGPAAAHYVEAAIGAMPNQSETSAPPLTFVGDEPEQQDPDTHIFALMSGKCSTLKVAGRNFACRAVAFFQSEQGRANFSIALDDPADDSHIVTFSGDNGRRAADNRYELPIDRMLLKSKDRPKVDGLPVPFVELSAGTCKQLGNFAAGQVSSISCTAMANTGQRYELQFESDGSPITIRRVRRSAPTIQQDLFR